MGSRPLAKGISQNFGQRNQKAAAVSSVQKCNGDHIQDLLGRGQPTPVQLREENEPLLRCTFREETRVGQGCRLMKLGGYGAVAVVMADAWGEEATQHVRRGHIFGASCPSVAANICFGFGSPVSNKSFAKYSSDHPLFVTQNSGTIFIIFQCTSTRL